MYITLSLSSCLLTYGLQVFKYIIQITTNNYSTTIKKIMYVVVHHAGLIAGMYYVFIISPLEL